MIYRKSLQSTAAMASWYDKKYQDMGGCWKTPEEEMYKHLDDFGLTGGHLMVLDVGCGDGSFVQYIRNRGYLSYGIEVSEQALEIGGHLHIWKQDICTNPTLATYDRIISLGSLEHVIDIDAALDNIRLSLTPEGRWYFYIPNELWKHNDQPNERTATDAEWTDLFRKHGLIVESSKRWNDSTAFQGSIRKTLSVEIGAVLCGGDGPKLAFNFLPLEEDSFTVASNPKITFIDPSIGDGIGNIHCQWYDNRTNLVTPCRAYQALLDATTADILCYSHDDLTVHDPDWLQQVMGLFEFNPNCIAVGLGGALGLGVNDLYKKRYHISQLQRIDYGSNAVDAEMHGTRVTGVRRVAVIEQYFMAVRVEWLRSRGGWPVEHCNHHMLDAFLACEAARDEKEIWQYAAALHHQGGLSSVSDSYKNASWLAGGTLAGDHIAPHRWIYENYPDVLPLMVVL